MNRILKLEQLCSKIGILNRTLDNKQLEWGPYGYLLLNRIKSLWMKQNLHKYSNNFLIESNDLKKLNLDYFNSSLLKAFNVNSLPIGIVNVFPAEINPLEPKPHHLLKGIKSVTNLSVHYIDECHPTVDFAVYWQNERLNWWTKFLNNPENMSVSKVESDDALEDDRLDTNLIYKIDELSIVCETISYFGKKKLENFGGLERLFKGKTNSLLVSKTTPEIILETVIFDSVDFPSAEENAELAKYELKKREKTKLSLDFLLAPFKIAILYKKDDADAKAIAKDLKDLMYAKNVDGVLVYAVDDDREALEAKSDYLDMLGVPYSIYLPSCVTKDGFCFIRNRETSLREKTHVSLLVKHFKAISDSLHF
jgi:hypothetical protein